MVTLIIISADSFCDSSLHHNPTMDLRLFCWEETCVILCFTFFFFLAKSIKTLSFDIFCFFCKKVVNVVNIVLTVNQKRSQ